MKIRFLTVAIANAVAAASLAGEPAKPKVQFLAAPKALPVGAKTHDWPSFLGPTQNNVCAETALAKSFAEGEPRLVWSVERGEGYAAPAITGERLIHFHRVGDVDLVECHDRETGAHHWTHAIPTTYQDRFNFSPGPRASPITDGERVYVHNVQGNLVCLALDTGKMVWSTNTSKTYRVPQDFFGVGPSPALFGKSLIVQVGSPVRPCVVAFDKLNGKVLWQSGQDWTAGYATPVVAEVHSRSRVFAFAGGDSDPPAGGLLVIDPANGKVDFEFPFRSKVYESVNASCPVIADNQVFLSTSYRTGGVALQLRAGGGYDLAWRTRAFGAHFATPIVRDGYLYGISGGRRHNTEIVCLDWQTGEVKWVHQPVWKEQRERDGKTEELEFTPGLGSLVWADGAFLMLSAFGHLVWAELSPTGYQELARTRLFRANETWCAPVISHGLIYIAQNKPDSVANTPPRLLCYDLRAAGAVNE